MTKVYQLNYSTEDYNKDYGFFTTREKAEQAKKEVLDRTDEDRKEYFSEEIMIYEIELNKILHFN